jgi:2-alkyl-3-oxoalkanoate reductase
VKQSILVTGYGGFLGAAVCRDLLQHGHIVHGIARGSYPELQKLGVNCIRGDATDLQVCNRACRGIDAIVHTAALAGVWGPAKIYESANVVATQNLLNAARNNSVGVFVFTSSPSVTFDGSPQENVDETVPYPTRWLCHYPRTKAIAEKRVLDSNDLDGLRTCSLRPHLIWGVDDPHLIPRVISRCRAGRLRRVGDGRNLIDTVHVDHAAIAHRLALDRLFDNDANVAGHAFFITDGYPIECWEWLRFIVESAGLVAPEKHISFASAYRIGSALETVYRMLGKSSEPPMTRFVAAQLGVAHYFDIASARERLGYVPMKNRDERLNELRQWIGRKFG